jgi:hypothetical protein
VTGAEHLSAIRQVAGGARDRGRVRAEALDGARGRRVEPDARQCGPYDRRVRRPAREVGRWRALGGDAARVRRPVRVCSMAASCAARTFGGAASGTTCGGRSSSACQSWVRELRAHRARVPAFVTLSGNPSLVVSPGRSWHARSVSRLTTHRRRLSAPRGKLRPWRPTTVGSDRGSPESTDVTGDARVDARRPARHDPQSIRIGGGCTPSTSRTFRLNRNFQLPGRLHLNRTRNDRTVIRGGHRNCGVETLQHPFRESTDRLRTANTRVQ